MGWEGKDQVVKSLRNWARAQASKAERRGRLYGRRGADDEEDDVAMVWGPVLDETKSRAAAAASIVSLDLLTLGGREMKRGEES